MIGRETPPPSPPKDAPLLPGRVRPLVDPVTITLDGEEIFAERGEPIAAALVAAGKMTLARSPKYHRPRGPSCLRAACDGCLARVDENPNVMTCLARAAEGTRVVSQNRLGPREADLLRVTDWFFPDGMNHHELFAGVPGVQSVMQMFARRVAGLGRLPEHDDDAPKALPPRRAARRACDVVVVGAGPSGMAIASRLASDGRAVEVLDDQLDAGGGLTALGDDEARAFAPIRTSFDEHTRAGRVRLRTATVAGGLYGRDVMVVGPEGAEILEPRALVLACGCHDGALAFEGNDIPGVMSARAAGWLLSRGVVPGRRVLVVVAPDGGPFGSSYAVALTRHANAVDAKRRPEATLVHGVPLRVDGSNRVKSVVVRLSSGEERAIDADALVVDAPRSPAYELAEQAGAALAHDPRGYLVATEDGRVGADDGDGRRVYAAGEMTGVPLDAASIAADADRVADAVQRDRA